MRSVLVIAGSDSGGGAGIQADLKALTALGVHGCTAITCVTAQNTRGVVSTYPLPLKALREQIRAVLDDIPVAAVKTGMLYSNEIVQAVAEELEGLKVPLVVDPVMVATAGSSLHESGFVEALREYLLPITTLVTPNLDEAEALGGLSISDVQAMRTAAESLHAMGAHAVLMKGGHLEGELVDILFDGKGFHDLPGHRFPGELHGSGCDYASSIAGYLALGHDLVASVSRARRRIAAGFATSYPIGKGYAVINSAYIDDMWGVWEAVAGAAEELEGLLPPEVVPEVGINLGYALPAATGSGDVCAVQGRMVRRGQRVVAVGPPGFGASRHVARIILAAMESDPGVRSAINLRYDEGLLSSSKKAGLRVGTFDRAREPPGVSTMDWGTREAIRSSALVPDLVYDLGGPGKVPMIRVLGTSPQDLLSKLRKMGVSR